ncbi:MAG: M20/M25/M40 family metallo-hydrolase [Chloroflexota bacterium]|nr:M20/M25/M40 family metallo-hydrolase [Chloroflexota bacterium]
MSNTEPSGSTPLLPLNWERLLRGFVDILSVDSYWGNEERVVAIIQPRLEAAGVVCRRDQIGNLICRWPAKGKDSPPIMLNAHMDTVLPTPEMTPVVKADAVYSDGSSVLGADDKAGVAAIVEAVAMVEEAGLPHGPIDLVFTVGEDVGQFGAAAFDPNDVESRVALVLDFGGPVGVICDRQAASCNFNVTFHGNAAAAAHPETGKSAVSMMARAIDRMPLGPVDELTVANVGIVSGGDARNIIPSQAKLVAQARALTQEALDRQVAAMRTALEDGAAAFGGRVEIETEQRFKPTWFGHDHPALEVAYAGVQAAGLEPRFVHTFGGSDAQNFNEKGIDSAILGTGYQDIHSIHEWMPHAELRKLTQVTAQVILNT